MGLRTQRMPGDAPVRLVFLTSPIADILLGGSPRGSARTWTLPGVGRTADTARWEPAERRKGVMKLTIVARVRP
jgi:hypothetical protein